MFDMIMKVIFHSIKNYYPVNVLFTRTMRSSVSITVNNFIYQSSYQPVAPDINSDYVHSDP